MHLVAALNDLLASRAKCGHTHVITIDGRAGSGKTTLANQLCLALSLKKSVTLIHLDEIYAGWRDALGPSLTGTLERVLKTLSKGESVDVPIFDWTAGAFLSERRVAPDDVLILEGVGSGQAKVREFASATIWLDIEAAVGLERVLNRDGVEIAEEMRQWQIDEDAHFYLDQTRENSDFILSTYEIDSAPSPE